MQSSHLIFLSSFKKPATSFKLVISFSVLLFYHDSVVRSENELDACNQKQKCDICLLYPECVWCYESGFDDSKRCFSRILRQSQNGSGVGCNPEFLSDPRSEFTVVESRALGEKKKLAEPTRSSSDSEEEEEEEELVQITPQLISMKLRPNEPQSVNVRFRQSQDYPVDIYFLMDGSNSMTKYVEQVQKIGYEVAGSIRKITKNFHLGFGMFLEKAVLPYDSHYPKQCEYKMSCDGGSPQDAEPFSFRHLMDLGPDVPEFTNTVNMTEKLMIPNKDFPEGGFDGLMQAMVCSEEIGWREQSRKMVIFLTDANYHYAGDGKLGGVVEPNDGRCHLDKEKRYTHFSILDYPSISHINYISVQKNINIIFVVTPDVLDIYKRLERRLKLATVGKLTNDSHIVVDLIRDEYKKITSEVIMEHKSSKLFDVKFYSRCLDTDLANPPTRRSICTELKTGSEIEFKVEIKLTGCPDDKSVHNEWLSIKPLGLNEELIVDAEMICNCTCEKENVEYNSASCSSMGTLKCGLCECNDDSYGITCGCVKGGGNEGLSVNENCRPANSSEEECSGKGMCKCGRCECFDEDVTGVYCQCDESKCFYTKSEPCSGNGKCECGKCVCNKGWTHRSEDRPACDCLASEETCIPPGEVDVCFGRGACDCGKCVCNKGYVGAYCEQYSMTMKQYQRCAEFESCVECLAHRTGKMLNSVSGNCSARCSFGIEFAEDIAAMLDETIDNGTASDIIPCNGMDSTGCPFSFFYYYTNNKAFVVAQASKPVCKKPNILKYILFVAGTVVIAGTTLLIVWKIATMTFDRLEYQRFMKQQAKARWDEGGNPLYKHPHSTFQNPMYGSRRASRRRSSTRH